MHWLRTYGYEALGGVFLVLSILTFLNVAAAWQVGEVLLWRALAYGVLDAGIAYAFWRRSLWLLPLFICNTAGMALLVLLKADTLWAGIPALMSAVIALFLYATKSAGEKQAALGVICAVLWAGLFGYSLLV